MVDQDEEPKNAEFALHSVGEQLKMARENLGMALEEVAKETRIPIRHLESIEKSQFSKLPGTTYAVGFTRSYAKILELNEERLISELRGEMIDAGQGLYHSPSQDFQPADPTSVPPKMLAWTAGIVALLIVAGYAIWRSMAMAGPEGQSGVETEQATAAQAEPDAPQSDPAKAVSGQPKPADPKGQVVITAIDTVWLKIYDADNKRLFEAEMKAGESYAVPQDANKPQIVTGRPDKIKITLAGREIAPLGDGSRTIADVGIGAADLAARADGPAGPAPPQ